MLLVYCGTTAPHENTPPYVSRCLSPPLPVLLPSNYLTSINTSHPGGSCSKSCCCRTRRQKPSSRRKGRRSVEVGATAPCPRTRRSCRRRCLRSRSPAYPSWSRLFGQAQRSNCANAGATSRPERQRPIASSASSSSVRSSSPPG